MNSSRLAQMTAASLLTIAALGSAPCAADLTAAGVPPAPAPAAVAPTMPAMSFPLVANPNPASLYAGPFGNVYVTGAVSALGLVQDNVFPGDRSARVDVSNAQVFIQNTTGPIQFFVQVGAYSLPALGVAY